MARARWVDGLAVKARKCIIPSSWPVPIYFEFACHLNLHAVRIFLSHISQVLVPVAAFFTLPEPRWGGCPYALGGPLCNLSFCLRFQSIDSHLGCVIFTPGEPAFGLQYCIALLECKCVVEAFTAAACHCLTALPQDLFPGP